MELAEEGHSSEVIGPVSAINSGRQLEELYRLINEAALITTAVGPNVLKLIAPSIAEGLRRRDASNTLNIIACENMIGGSSFLKKEIYSHLTEAEQESVSETVGFPNSAVDRIVPIQHHEDPLKVSVEPFFEWVIDESGFKGKTPAINGALFVDDLTPYIERKLFTVNTGHAVTAYVAISADSKRSKKQSIIRKSAVSFIRRCLKPVTISSKRTALSKLNTINISKKSSGALKIHSLRTM